MSYRFLYLRDHSTGSRDPIGCIMVLVKKEDKQIHYAFSVCAPCDQFDRTMAQDLALGRLYREPIIIKTEIPGSSHGITRLIMEDILKHHAVQSKTSPRSASAFQSATYWLTEADKRRNPVKESSLG